MDHINRLAYPKHCVTKFVNRDMGHSFRRHVNNKQSGKPCQPKNSISTSYSLKPPPLATTDEGSVPRPSNMVAPSIVRSVRQPKPIFASDPSLELGCGDSSPGVSIKGKSSKLSNLKRTVFLSQPRVIPVNPNVKNNPYTVAKSATKPLSHRRIRHIQTLCQVPKRKAQPMITRKKKLTSTKLNKKKDVSKQLNRC